MSEGVGADQVEVRDAGFDDIRAIQGVARTTWEHTYRETIPEGVRAEFVSQAYSLLLEAGIGRFSDSTRYVLRVEQDNALAKRFYEAHGFRRAGEHTDHFYGHVVNEVEMILEARSGTC